MVRRLLILVFGVLGLLAVALLGAGAAQATPVAAQALPRAAASVVVADGVVAYHPQAPAQTAPAGPVISPDTQGTAADKNKIVAGAVAVVLLFTVWYGRRVRKKRQGSGSS